MRTKSTDLAILNFFLDFLAKYDFEAVQNLIQVQFYFKVKSSTFQLVVLLLLESKLEQIKEKFHLLDSQNVVILDLLVSNRVTLVLLLREDKREERSQGNLLVQVRIRESSRLQSVKVNEHILQGSADLFLESNLDLVFAPKDQGHNPQNGNLDLSIELLCSEEEEKLLQIGLEGVSLNSALAHNCLEGIGKYLNAFIQASQHYLQSYHLVLRQVCQRIRNLV